MSRQRRSCFALKCAVPDCAETAAPGFPMTAGQPFTLGATFYIERLDCSGTFLRQENAFELGMENRTVYFSSRALGRIESDPLAQSLVENDWNRADVVYDGTNLKLYLQGGLTGKRAANKTAPSPTDTLSPWQMGLIDGYLQEVSFYARALTGGEVLKNQFSPVVQTESAELFVDFDAFIPADTGRHKLPVRLTGKCDTVNLVQSLKSARRGCAMPVGSPDINIGGSELSAFTLLVKCYPAREKDSGDVCLVANGREGDAQLVELGLCRGQTTPFFRMCGQRFESRLSLAEDSWNDVAVSVSGSAVKLYVDGQDAGSGTMDRPSCRAGGTALTFGNILSKDKRFKSGFVGWLDSVVVFAEALSAEKLTGYADIAPFVFDGKLKALWAFYEEDGAELLQSGVLSYTGDAKVTLGENTVLDRTPPPLVFAMPDTQTGLDDIVKWQARTAAEAICESIGAVTGLVPAGGIMPSGELNGSVESMVAGNWNDMTQLVDMETKQQCSSADIRELFGAVAGGAMAGLAVYAFYCSLQNKGYRRVSFVTRFLRFFAKGYLGQSGAAQVLEIVGASAGALTAYLAEHQSPDAEEGTCSEYAIELKSLSFYNEKSKDAGALRLRPDFDHPPVLPEWNGGSGEKAPALYHSSAGKEKVPVLRAVLHIDPGSGCEPAIRIGATAVTADGYSDLLGDLPSKSVTVTAAGDVTVDFELTNSTLRDRPPGEYKIKWNWVHSLDGTDRILGGTEQTVYLLHAAPLPPWTTAKDSAMLPVSGFVRLCASVSTRQNEEQDPERKFCNQFVDWAQRGDRLTAAAWSAAPAYAWWDKYHRKLSLDGKKFASALNGDGKVSGGALDTACLQFLLARLEGFAQLRLCFCKACCRGLKLHLRGGKAPGGGELEPVWMGEYPACCIPKSSSTPDMYDAFLQLKDGAGVYRQVAGIPFCGRDEDGEPVGPADETKYRTMLCREGTFCRIALDSDTLFPGVKPLGTLYPAGPREIKKASGRPDFTPQIKNALKLPSHPVRCHGISFDYIESTIAYIINHCLNMESGGDENCEQALKLLCRAVTGYDEDPGYGTDGSAHSAFYDASEVYTSLGNDIEELTNQCNLLASSLHSILWNLHKGDSDWNSSIQDAFDPLGWIHVIADGAGALHCDCRHTEAICDDPPAVAGAPEIIDPGFYLTDADDGKRLSRILDLVALTDDEWSAPPICQSCIRLECDPDPLSIGVSDSRRRLLSSSVNQWNRDKYAYDEDIGIEPVFALVDSEWKAIYVPEETED